MKLKMGGIKILRNFGKYSLHERKVPEDPNFQIHSYLPHHHHKHPGLAHLTCSVSRVTAALSIASSVSQLFSFLAVCSGMISRGFAFVAFFVCVRASSFCIHLSCPVCSLSVVRGEWICLFCSHRRCSTARGLSTFISAASILRLCEAVKVQFSDPYKNVGKTKVLYNCKLYVNLLL